MMLVSPYFFRGYLSLVFRTQTVLVAQEGDYFPLLNNCVLSGG